MFAAARNLIGSIKPWWDLFVRITQAFYPLADLVLRLYVARVFMLSGYSKISDWSSTLDLFHNEYHVPLLNPTFAAYLATAGELGLSSLLALGVGTRFAAAGLSVLNITAVLSYYDTLKTVPGALQDHLQWGLMLFMLLTLNISVTRADYYLNRFFQDWLSGSSET